MRRIFAAGLLLAVAIAAAGGVSTARAAFPGGDGLVAFDDTYTHNIYTVKTDGTGMKQLTTNGRSVAPRWSANGKLIAFSSAGQLWVMNANGSGKHRVGTVTRAYQPAFSRDGKTLAYVHVPQGQGGDIFTIPVAGGTPKQWTHDGATTCGDSHPVFSPISTTIISYDQQLGTHGASGCASPNGYPRVITQNGAAGSKHVIAHAANPDYTADGKGFVFNSDVDQFGTELTEPELFGSNLAGGLAQRVGLTLSHDCIEGDDCYYEGAAAPTSTVGHYDAAFVLSRETGEYCISLNLSPQQRGFCTGDASTFFPENIDWQSTH